MCNSCYIIGEVVNKSFLFLAKGDVMTGYSFGCMAHLHPVRKSMKSSKHTYFVICCYLLFRIINHSF